MAPIPAGSGALGYGYEAMFFSGGVEVSRRVLGIDPGLSRCGYGLVGSSGGRFEALAAGVISTPPEMELSERLLQLHGELSRLMAEATPTAVVVERVLFQRNARTAMSVGQAAGLAILAAANAGCEVASYSANEVKLAVAGWGGASKVEVQRMVAKLLGLERVPKPPDVADALALALTHAVLAPRRQRLESRRLA